MRIFLGPEQVPEAPIVAGWGEVGNSMNSAVINAAYVSIVDRQTCQQSWSTQDVTLMDSMICAGAPNTGTCYVSL